MSCQCYPSSENEESIELIQENEVFITLLVYKVGHNVEAKITSGIFRTFRNTTEVIGLLKTASGLRILRVGFKEGRKEGNFAL